MVEELGTSQFGLANNLEINEDLIIKIFVDQKVNT